MGFLHIWAIIAGTVAIGLPVAVHYLTRPRPVKVSLSTLRFVQEAVHQRQARHRLRDALILLSRIAAIILLALAFARPLTGAARNTAEANADTQRIVILDASASMAAVSHGVPTIERARGVAAHYIEQKNGLRANLIIAGFHSHPVFDRPSANLAALRDELSRARVRPEKLNLQSAIAAAAEMFAIAPNSGPSTRRELVIVSDLQRTNWTGVDFSVLPKDTQIQVETVATADTPDNLAITGVNVRGRAAAGASGQLDVDVCNYSKVSRQVQLEVSFDGRTYNVEKLCVAGALNRVNVDITFGAKGWQIGEARLAGVNDALPADNSRAFIVQVHPAPTYLLVSRDGAEPRATSSNYIERALAPAGPTGPERVLRAAGGQIDRQALAEADAVILDRPGRLDGQAVALLATSLRRGKSILYVASDSVDAVNLGALAAQAGSDLRMPVEFLPPTGKNGVRRNLSLAEVRRNDPVFEIFGNALQPTLDALRFTACLNSRPVAGGLTDDVLATYFDRTACLVATNCGQGTLVVFNADLSESNIVSTGAFVPLIGQLTNRMLSSRSLASVDCGEPAALVLDADAGNPADLIIAPPPGAPEEKGRIAEEHGAQLWRMDAVPAPGVYRILRGNNLVGALAAVIPAEESDLTSLSPGVLTDRLSGGRQVTVHSAATEGNRESGDRAWVWLAAGAALALLAEMAILRIFRA